MYEFEPGVAYRFTPCMEGVKSFVAVAAERHAGRDEVEFVVPLNLISGFPMVMDGREILKVNVEGHEYCARAAVPLDVSAAFDLLEKIKDARAKMV